MDNYGKLSIITAGPWGGQDGDHWDDGVYSTVRQIEIAHGTGIDSITLEYDLNGTSVWSRKHGGLGGNKFDKIKLQYPEEFLTSIHGHYGSLQGWGPILIKSLTLISNKRTYGPFGTEEGIYFSLPVIGGKIVGFHGRGGWYVDAIGIHLEPLHKQNSQKFVVQYSQGVYASNESFGYSTIEGNIGKQFDVLVALRQKDEKSNNSLPNYLTRQNHFNVADQPVPKEIIQVVPSPTFPRVPYKNVQGVFTYGPWGGTGGTIFDDPIYDGVRQINVKRNVGITSVKVCYDYRGKAVWENKNGGKGSFKEDMIVFDYPSEILTHVTGYHGPTMVMGPNVIKSLTFYTTKTKYGPYGEEQGTPFSTYFKEGKIVGFHGRKGLFIDAIGVYVMEGKVMVPKSNSPVPPVSPPTKVVVPMHSATKVVLPVASSNQQNTLAVKEVDATKWSFKSAKRGVSQDQASRVVKDPAPHGTGPWGGEGGKPWDDGVFTGIRQIILTTSSDVICSIEIEYDRSGQSVWSVLHGSNRGETSHRVKLEFPHEVVTCISGYYGPITKEEGIMKLIKSLTIHTSRRKCGPFGEELGTYFTSATTEGKVVGFHGRSSMYLDAIGVHMQHWLGTQKPKHHYAFYK